MEIILYGDNVPVAVSSKKYPGTEWNTKFEGIIKFLEKQKEEGTEKTRKWIEDFMTVKVCDSCEGARLKKESLHFKVGGANISELARMNIAELGNWFSDVEERLTNKQKQIAPEVLKEIRKRIGFLLDVGLDYLTLNRPLRTLSGGEAQRVKLASELSKKDTGSTFYILDEPTTGLHFEDIRVLLGVLNRLVNKGNTVLIIEHNLDVIKQVDYIVDIGPEGGKGGGAIVAQGIPEAILENKNSHTAHYLKKEFIAYENNLK